MGDPGAPSGLVPPVACEQEIAGGPNLVARADSAIRRCCVGGQLISAVSPGLAPSAGDLVPVDQGDQWAAGIRSAARNEAVLGWDETRSGRQPMRGRD